MARPVIKWLRGWLSPAIKPDIPDKPAPVIPEPAVPKPTGLPLADYVRALLVLRAIPFKKLRIAFLALPLRQIFYVIGCVIWVIMTYSFITYILR